MMPQLLVSLSLSYLDLGYHIQFLINLYNNFGFSY